MLWHEKREGYYLKSFGSQVAGIINHNPDSAFFPPLVVIPANSFKNIFQRSN